MKGFVLGPVHKNQKDDIDGTNLEEIDPTFGSEEDFDTLLQSAKKKGGGPGVGKGAARKGLVSRTEEGQGSIFVRFAPDRLSALSGQEQSSLVGLQAEVDPTGDSETLDGAVQPFHCGLQRP